MGGQIVMPRENYRRIVRGYEPIEPAAFFEKVFYLFWLLICAFKVIPIRVKSRKLGLKKDKKKFQS